MDIANEIIYLIGMLFTSLDQNGATHARGIRLGQIRTVAESWTNDVLTDAARSLMLSGL